MWIVGLVSMSVLKKPLAKEHKLIIKVLGLKVWVRMPVPLKGYVLGV